MQARRDEVFVHFIVQGYPRRKSEKFRSHYHSRPHRNMIKAIEKFRQSPKGYLGGRNQKAWVKVDNSKVTTSTINIWLP